MTLIKPMLATPGVVTDPRFSEPAGSGWSYEMKWDGVRAVVYVDETSSNGTAGGGVTVFSRNDRDVSVSYPELQPLGGVLAGREAVLDGEIVAIDDAGRPSFGRLQQRMHVTDPRLALRLSQSVPAVLLLFDILRLDGHSVLDQPYSTRREMLEELALSEAFVQTPPAFDTSAVDALHASEVAGLEGVVAKRVDSVYRPGQRSPDWVKIKHIRMQEVVVVGWRPGQGRRTNTIGSLLMGVQTDVGLQYIGHVGTGFSDALLRQLSARLAQLQIPDPPFSNPLPREITRDAHWVRPELVGEVAFTEWTGDDRLRHPSWRGLRPDKDAADVVREA